MDDQLRANRDNWDERAAHHPTTDYYDVEGFLRGESSLMDLEREELGDVAGKTMLHLQCHFGLDTLSWVREGATVTGVDFSPVAVETARDLRDESGIDPKRARFVESDVCELPDALADERESFDVVFTSYGVLCWLPNLDGWAEVIDYFLRPGGTFYVAEIHPVVGAISAVEGDEATFGFPYFEGGSIRFEEECSYTDGDPEFDHDVVYEWTHSLSDVLNALLGAGLELEFVREFPKCCYRRYPNMVGGEDGWWRLPDGPDLPFTFSVRATKPR